MAISKTRAKGADGLSPRERAFVQHRRDDPEAPGWQIAKRAGFQGDEKTLKRTAQKLMKIAVVHRAVFAPRSAAEERRSKNIDQLTDAELGMIVKQTWLDIVRSGHAAPGDKARAAAMLGKTIAKFFVPLEVNNSGTLTLEQIVESMGGAPPDHRSRDREEVH